MSDERTCSVLGDAALVDHVLGDLVGTAQTAVRVHLERCPACRADVAELTDALGSVLIIGPGIDPPVGFEDRVLRAASCGVLAQPPTVRRLRHRTRARRLLTAAAALVLVLVGPWLTDGARHAATIDLVTASAQPAGSAAIESGPTDVIDMRIDRRAISGAYLCEVVLRDGTVVSLGELEDQPDPDRWSGPLPVPMEDVREVRVVDEQGVELASGQVDS